MTRRCHTRAETELAPLAACVRSLTCAVALAACAGNLPAGATPRAPSRFEAWGTLCACARGVAGEHARAAIGTVLGAPGRTLERDLDDCSGALRGVPIPHTPRAASETAGEFSALNHAADESIGGAALCHASAFAVALAARPGREAQAARDLVTRLTLDGARADAFAAIAAGLLVGREQADSDAARRSVSRAAHALERADLDGELASDDAWRRAEDAWAAVGDAARHAIDGERRSWRELGVQPALFSAWSDLPGAPSESEDERGTLAAFVGAAGVDALVPDEHARAVAHAVAAIELGETGLLLEATSRLAAAGSALARLGTARATRDSRAVDSMAAAIDLVPFYSDVGRTLAALRTELFGPPRARQTR